MKQTRIRLVAGGLATVLAAFGLPSPAMAQGAPASDGFADIVVTARKVAEASQSLPITVAAFTGQELSNKVVLNIRDLGTVTPGLTVNTNSQGGAPIFAIRGTATENFIDGGVALYLNDVALVSSIPLINQFYDISAIEVLKGPQGTQFGTNTTGGTISVRTNEPTRKLEAFLKAGYGNYNRAEVEGMVNLPVNDVLQLRLAGQWIRRDGHINNPEGAGVISKTFGGEDHYSLRGSMLVNSGPVTNLLVVDYYHENNQQLVQVPVAFGPNAQGVDLGNLGVDLNGNDISRFNEKLGDRTTVHIGPNVLSMPGTDRELYVRGTLWGIQDRLNIAVSDSLSIRNVVGYRDDYTDSSENNSGTTLVQIMPLTRTWTQQWSDDLTLQYRSSDNRLRLSAGGYWQSRKKEVGLVGNVVQATLLKYGIPAFGVAPAPLSVILRNLTKYDNTSKALYANAEFDVTPTLAINGGFRYNWDTSRLSFSASQGIGLTDTGFNYLPGPGVPCNVPGLGALATKDITNCFGYGSGAWKAPSWTVGVTNRFTSRILAYAKVSHGYLAGGLNTSLREVPAFDPETKTEYEVGLKADWALAGRPLRTNVALFYNKTKNKQVIQNANYDDSGAGVGVLNAAQESVYGIDLETRFSPVQGLTLEANYNYVHAKFDSFIVPALGGNADGKTGFTLLPSADLSGNPPAQTPKHQLNLAATWELPLEPASGKLSATVSAYYTSQVTQNNVLSPYNAAFGLKWNTLPSYWIVNASANWANVMGSPVTAQAWVRNLFDKSYWVFTSDQFQAFGYTTAIFGTPRTFGASVSVKF